MEEILITIAISIAGPALLGIFGLIWKLSSKVHLHEKILEAHDRSIRETSAKLQKLDDKQYSLVRNIPKT